LILGIVASTPCLQNRGSNYQLIANLRFHPMKKVLFLIFSLTWFSPLQAQLNNAMFEDRVKVLPEDTGRLVLGINAMGFSKDNEYFGTIVDGYTLYGFQFAPELRYQIAPHWRINAGLWTQKDFGNAKFSTVAPLFSIKFQKDDFTTIFGNLEGSLNHRLIEPLYDFERVLLETRLEHGGQIIVNKENFFLDGWVNWQLMQYLNDPRQEEMTGGLSAEKKLGIWRGAKVSLPFQAVVKHKGGQLDVNPDPLITIWNSATGLQLEKDGKGRIKNWRLSGWYLYYKDMSFKKRQEFLNGSGLYLNLNLKFSDKLESMVSYWKGHEFQTVEGGKIYPSVGVLDPSLIRPDRELLIWRLLFSEKVNDAFSVGGRLEPYYDFNFGGFQWSFGIYLVYHDNFFLGKSVNP